VQLGYFFIHNLLPPLTVNELGIPHFDDLPILKVHLFDTPVVDVGALCADIFDRKLGVSALQHGMLGGDVWVRQDDVRLEGAAADVS
jgi:hypothetical protein